MNIDYPSMFKIISQIAWPISRFSGLFLTAPFFSSNSIPANIKIVFIFVLSWVCSYMVPEELSFEHFSGIYFVYVIQELAYGLLMGFILQIVFQVFVLSGQIISMQAGLGFAVMVDPTSKASVPVVSQFFSFMVLLVFLAINGHIALLESLITSFKVMPIGSLNVDTGVVWGVIAFSGWMFKEAVLIAIPAIFSLTMVSLSFGIITRVAPQINIFSFGLPVTLLMSIVIIQVCLPSTGQQMIESLEQGMHVVLGMLR